MPWPIIGHEWAVTLLQRSLAAGQQSHAYLFSGPPQVGKTTLARALAQALNCTQADPPCGQCASCLKIAHGTHPDVQIVVGKGAGESIQIDQIRALQREAALAPYEGRYRVFILRQMDRATPEAANSLLKTLEEPPGRVVLALTAVHPEGVAATPAQREGLPPTVLSRCQRLGLRPVASAVVEAGLIERGISAPQARFLSRLSAGRVGWAISASQDDSILRQRQQDLDQLLNLLAADRVTRLDFAWKSSRDPAATRRQIELWIGWWRDVLLMRSMVPDAVVNIDQVDRLAPLAEQLLLPQVWALLKALQETADQLEANVNPRLAMEGLLLRLPYHAQAGQDAQPSQRIVKGA